MYVKWIGMNLITGQIQLIGDKNEVYRSKQTNARGYYKMFDNEAEARDFLNTEEYDFCERTLYTDFDEFVEDWCYADENNGTWDERLEQYTNLFDRTDWQKKMC